MQSSYVKYLCKAVSENILLHILLFLNSFILCLFYYHIAIIIIFMFCLGKTFARNRRITVPKLVAFGKTSNKIVQKDC